MRQLRLFIAIVALGLPAWAVAAQALLTAKELDTLSKANAVRIVDVRDAQAYSLQHVPGAVSAPYGRWRGPAANPGQLPSLAELTSLVQELGLTPETHAVVVYTGVDSSDFGSAARVYWTLKMLGLKEISILNGGLATWKSDGFPISNQPAKVARSSYQPSMNTSMIATESEVLTKIGDSRTNLIDSRPAPFFTGRVALDSARARGTLPGAVNIDSDLYFEPGSAALMDKASLEQEANAASLKPGGEVIAFCNTGHWSATEWFVRSEVLGQSYVKLYPGSMVEWTQSAKPLPMMNEPERWAQLRYKLMTWSHRNLGTKAP
ncbi:sulfurtransferase [Ottowia thiooxydans]|uniref:sulfurtransferase n=1 Tax=Ottowia thiooxydans TaxID=219182 RepID=UPI00040DCABA|nr:rhodanese-like domain-containing protein [Ottowia thiooxydans]